MTMVNGGAAGANEGLAQVYGARGHGAGQAAAPVAGPPVAPVAGPLVAPLAVALFPQALVPARFDVDGALLGPLPTKSNESCEILPKIAGETWP